MHPPLAEVKQVIVETLGIEDRADDIDASTRLLGSLPELDSLSVVELAAALEERFSFTIDDSDFTADIFETVGSLAEFVRRNCSEACHTANTTA
jgi:acyl carrier protein